MVWGRTGIATLAVLATLTGGAGPSQALADAQAAGCPVASLVGGSGTSRQAGPGIDITTWKQPKADLKVLHIRVDLRKARAAVADAPPGRTASVRQLGRRFNVAINAGYIDERTGLPKGPLLGTRGAVFGAGTYQSKNRQTLAYSKGKALFSRAKLEGKLKLGLKRIRLVGINDISSGDRGLVLLSSSFRQAAWGTTGVPAGWAAVRVRGGKLAAGATGQLGNLLATTDLTLGRDLAKYAGKRANVTWDLVSARKGSVLDWALPLGSAYVTKGKSRFGACRTPRPWQSRPRMAVAVEDKGATLHIVAVRGGPVSGMGQYDSGATEADMAKLLLRLGLSRAYALDAGSALQVLDNTRKGARLLDRYGASTFLWERPVSAVLGLGGAKGSAPPSGN